MKRIVILSAIVLLLAGCQNQQVTDRAMAKQRWQGARATVICGVGHEYLKVGELDKAQANAQEALALQENLLSARVLLGKVYLEKGQFSEAASELRRAQALAPRNPDIPYLLGIALEKRGQWDEALESYREAMGLDEANNAYVMAAAEVLVAKGQPKDALTLLSVRLAKIDGDAGMLSLTGGVALQADEPAKAAEYYQQALDLRKEDVTLREGLAKAHYFAGHYTESLAQLRKLAAHADYRDKSGWVYSMTGDCLLSLGQIAEAKSAYETACRLDPGEAQVWVGLSKTSLAAKDYQRTALSAKRALAIEPTSAEASLLLGYALLCDGQTDAAQKCLEPAAKQHPDDPLLRCALGRCYDAKGLKNRASDCYLQALKSDPGNVLAKSLLALADEPVGPVRE
jgi:Tfp pilus assembly protein PilF